MPKIPPLNKLAPKLQTNPSSGKKCIPGLFCIENMTLFILIVLVILAMYFYYVNVLKPTNINITVTTQPTATRQHTIQSSSIATRQDPINDPYTPPMRTDGMYFPPDSGDIRGIPVNVRTRPLNTSYQQMGILTRNHSRNGANSGDSILPLMGRQVMSGRDKWQYYTTVSYTHLTLPTKRIV